MAEATRIANRSARVLWRTKTLNQRQNRPIPPQINELVSTLQRHNFTNVSPAGDIYQIIVNFTTPEGKVCHITLHTGGRTDMEGSAGAFHIKIEDLPDVPRSRFGAPKEKSTRYYRFEPVVVTVDGVNVLHFQNINYVPQGNVFGGPKPITPPILNTHMQTVMGLLNSVNILMGTSPEAVVLSEANREARIAAAANRWGVAAAPAAAAPAAPAAAPAAPPAAPAAAPAAPAAPAPAAASSPKPGNWNYEGSNGGRRKRKQTKKRKINRRRTRRSRN